MQVFEGFAEIAGIGGEQDIARRELYLQRLVPRRMAMGGHRHHRAVAEQVEFAVDLANLVAVVVVFRIENIRFKPLRMYLLKLEAKDK